MEKINVKANSRTITIDELIEITNNYLFFQAQFKFATEWGNSQKVKDKNLYDSITNSPFFDGYLFFNRMFEYALVLEYKPLSILLLSQSSDSANILILLTDGSTVYLICAGEERTKLPLPDFTDFAAVDERTFRNDYYIDPELSYQTLTEKVEVLNLFKLRLSRRQRGAIEKYMVHSLDGDKQAYSESRTLCYLTDIETQKVEIGLFGLESNKVLCVKCIFE